MTALATILEEIDKFSMIILSISSIINYVPIRLPINPILLNRITFIRELKIKATLLILETSKLIFSTSKLGRKNSKNELAFRPTAGFVVRASFLL
jgi:hypothetical protein